MATLRAKTRELLAMSLNVATLVGSRLAATPISGILIVTVAIGLALAVRYPLLAFKSQDFFASLKPWYNAIRSEGFSIFATNFSTYSPPYLYLLYLIARFLPDTPVVIAVKLPGLIADFVCAYLTYRIVRLKYRGRMEAFLAGCAVLFAPTVILNSAFWGQADTLFTAGTLACVYFLMVKKYPWAFFAFGIALAFKLQAIFLAPLLAALFLRGEIRWKYLLLVPAMLLLSLVPAWIAGRPPLELLNIYSFQTSQFEFITMNAASLYAWLPGTKQVFNLFYVPGIIMGAAVAFLLTVAIYKSSGELSKPLVLELALLTNLIVPFFLPKMHERYFFPADILSIAFAFYYPQLFFVPLMVIGVSFLSYEPFLFNSELVPLPILTLLLLGAISIVSYHAFSAMYAPAVDGVEAPSEKSGEENEIEPAPVEGDAG
jgi:Gpi18-like mannosyltransferase